MAGVAHRRASLGTPGEGLPVAAPLRSTGLTAVALATLALGLALLLLPGLHAAPEIPTLLFLAALAMLVVTLLLSRSERTSASPAAPTETPETPRSVDPGPPNPARAPKPAASVTARSTVPGRGSAWRILSSPTEPGNETWLSWLPREIRRLGPEAGSVGPGVVTSPGRAGNLVAIPVRDYFGGALPPAARGAMTPLPPKMTGRGLVGDEHLPALATTRAAPFSEEELDRMFPPGGQHGRVFLPTAPTRIGAHSRWAIPPADRDPSMELSEELSRRAGPEGGREADDDISLLSHRWVAQIPVPSTSPADAVDRKAPAVTSAGRIETPSTELRREAANPIPPHLRGSGTLIRTRPLPMTRGGHLKTPPRSVCASCSKVVIDLRLSGPCPRCLRPLCHDCLRDALASVGHGWCADCSRAAVAA